MILLADSGSTKTDWVVMDANGKRFFSTKTKGLNPETLSEEKLMTRLEKGLGNFEYRETISKGFFYSAGCDTERLSGILQKVLQKFFKKADFLVAGDTYGSAHATTALGDRAIVCILGTGSNCSYYDGEVLHQKVISLGHLIMDDCSGNKLGRELLRAYNFGLLPKELSKKLVEEYNYNMDTDEIKVSLYKKNDPNSYLATFAKFIIENKHHPFMLAIIENQIQIFIDYYIKQYENCYEVPINFTGSIGFYLKEELEKKLSENGLKIGKVLQKPIEGLVGYIVRKYAKKPSVCSD